MQEGDSWASPVPPALREGSVLVRRESISTLTTQQFLEQLRERDVRLRVEGGVLRCDGPRDALTEPLKAEIAMRKQELMAYLAPRARASSLVPVQPRGEGQPFYGVPDFSGDVFVYVKLAQRLGHPFYAFEPPLPDGGPWSAENLAERFVNDLLEHQSVGPFYIGGYCTGGIVAYEMARQLRQRGHDIAMLALLDTPMPHLVASTWRNEWVRLRWHYGELRRLPWKRKIRYIRDFFARLPRELERRWIRWWLPAAAEVPSSHATLGHVDEYVPSAYPGKIHLFFSHEAFGWCGLGWARLARHCEILAGPNHCRTGMMLQAEPYVSRWADELRRCMATPAPKPPGAG